MVTRQAVETKVQAALREHDLDVLVAASPWNVAYTAGTSFFTQRTIPERLALVVMARDRAPVFIFCTIEEEHARNESWLTDRRGYTEFAEKPIDVLAGVVRELGAERGRIGIEKRFLVAGNYDELRAALPAASIVEGDRVFDQMKAIKTPKEIAWLRQTVLWTDEAVALAFSAARPGETERRIGDHMIAYCRAHGAGGLLHLALATGPNFPKVHHEPDDTVLEPGGTLRTDFGMFWGHYVSDIARTAFLKPAQEEQLQTYRLLEAMHQTVIAGMNPGVRASEVYALCAATFERNGLRLTMPHVGHSIGHSVHEHPMLHPFDQTVLEPGMVLMLEPMIATPEGPIHTEDMIEITGDGHRILSRWRDWSEPLVVG